MRTTKTFQFFWCGYLEVVGVAGAGLRQVAIADCKLLGLFTGHNTDSFL